MDRTLVGVNPVEAGDEGMARVDADVLPEAEGDPALRGEEADAAAEGQLGVKPGKGPFPRTERDCRR